MVDTLYSIGYSGFSVDEFIYTLHKKQVSLVVDVRSHPYSQWFSAYNRENIAQTLKKAGIYYRNYSSEFGARQEDKNYYSRDGYLDFELFSKSPQFIHGMEKLITSMKKDYCFVLMCAEKDPFNCHRTMLVSRAFHDAGYHVVHLMPNGKEIMHEEIESRLLETYFPNRNQTTLFAEPRSDKEYLVESYRKRNSEIGYSMEDENK